MTTPPVSDAARKVAESDMPYSKNERAEKIMGLRNPSGAPLLPIDQPVELGYWCPVCRVAPMHGGSFDERLQWSEYAGFLWCSECNYDYPSALCVRLEGEVIPQRAVDGTLIEPSYMWGGRDYAVSTFLGSVESAIRAARRSGEEAMRERCAKLCAERAAIPHVFDDDEFAAYEDTQVEAAIRALPLSGEGTGRTS